MRQRNQWLDVLRGLAILLVLGHHSTFRWIRPWTEIGWAGVDLFFVLSGFLISGLLFAEYQRSGGIALSRFWIRRGFKIYPSFYTLLGVAVLVVWVDSGSVPRAFLGDFFFLQNYAPHMLDYCWSLAVEEHFYFGLPLLLLLLMRLRGTNPFWLLPYISVALTIFCLWMRAIDHHVIWFATHLRLDGLFCGVTLGYYQAFQPASFPQRSRWQLVPLSIICFLPAGLWGMSSVGLTLTFLSAACLLLWAVPRKCSRLWSTRLLAWIGKYSYSIYLWHVPVWFLFLYFLPPRVRVLRATPAGDSGLACLIYLSVAIGIGVLTAKVIELPALRLRERLVSSV